MKAIARERRTAAAKAAQDGQSCVEKGKAAKIIVKSGNEFAEAPARKESRARKARENPRTVLPESSETIYSRSSKNWAFPIVWSWFFTVCSRGLATRRLCMRRQRLRMRGRRFIRVRLLL